PELVALRRRHPVGRGCREVQQLDLELAVGDHLRGQSHWSRDLERAAEAVEHGLVELVGLGAFEAEALAVEAQRTFEIGNAKPDGGGPATPSLRRAGRL